MNKQTKAACVSVCVRGGKRSGGVGSREGEANCPDRIKYKNKSGKSIRKKRNPSKNFKPPQQLHDFPFNN